MNNATDTGAATLVLIGAGLWGLHMGLTQGLLSKLVADSSPAELRGTAFGIFGIVSRVAVLIASTIAGSLWDNRGPAATFVGGAAFAALALIALVATSVWTRHDNKQRD
ncbi:MAG: MFS transporter [Bauldia sp.]